eukprot:Colp12_sorted_trinity150504_noHs@15513
MANKQEELRRLMREAYKTKGKVDSPYAKYNDAGKLTCIVCNKLVGSDDLWPSHLQSKSHKERFVLYKKQSFAKPTASAKAVAAPVAKAPAVIPARAPSDSASAGSKRKNDTATEGDAKRAKVSLVDAASSEEEEVEEEEGEGDDTRMPHTAPATNDESHGSNDVTPSGLPPGFFDNPPAPAETIVTTKGGALPEGFFDDPIKDAKVRNVKAPTTIDEDWELFQKEMMAEQTKAEVEEKAEEQEELQKKDVEELNEHQGYLNRLQQLRARREAVRAQSGQKPAPAPMDVDEHTEDLSEEEDFSDVVDWRVKRL